MLSFFFTIIVGSARIWFSVKLAEPTMIVSDAGAELSPDDSGSDPPPHAARDRTEIAATAAARAIRERLIGDPPLERVQAACEAGRGSGMARNLRPRLGTVWRTGATRVFCRAVGGGR